MLSTKDKCRLHLPWAANSSANTLDEHPADLIHPGVAPQPYTKKIAAVSKWHSCMTTACAGDEECSREITASHEKFVASCAIGLEEITHL